MAKNIFKIDRSNVESLDLKMLLIIGGIVVLFFLFVYPMLTKKETFSTSLTTSLDSLKSGAMDMVETFTNLKERLVDYTLDAGCAKPEEKKVETMADVQKTTQMTINGSFEAPSGNVDSHKVDTQMCSKSCCSPQWGHQAEGDDRVMANDLGSKYFATNYTCNGENPGDQGNGCVCVSKDTFGYLGNRGGNNME
jgi:hypothetical protein